MAKKTAPTYRTTWEGASWSEAAEGYKTQLLRAESEADAARASYVAPDDPRAARGQQLELDRYEANFMGSALPEVSSISNFLQQGNYLPDMQTFDPAGFDPWAHVRGTRTGDKLIANTTADDVYKRLGMERVSPENLSQAEFDKAQQNYITAVQRLFVDDPKNPLIAIGDNPVRIAERNILYADYADLGKRFMNSQSAAGSASRQTLSLQNKMRGLIKGQGNFFENLKESAEADVRIGSNVQSQRRAKKTSRSTNAATARSKVLVRAPGINI